MPIASVTVARLERSIESVFAVAGSYALRCAAQCTPAQEPLLLEPILRSQQHGFPERHLFLCWVLLSFTNSSGQQFYLERFAQQDGEQSPVTTWDVHRM